MLVIGNSFSNGLYVYPPWLAGAVRVAVITPSGAVTAVFRIKSFILYSM
jgi:hypothetical protein